MSRLFVTPREINFISDINKELIKDVGGQKIFYYPISELKTKTHVVYAEAAQKVFDNPISLDAIVDASFQNETKIDQFGIDQQYKLEVFVQYRDLVEKNINVCIGDYFSHGEIFYEIADTITIKNIFGLAEHKSGVKMTGVKARDTQFKTKLLGPTDISNTDDDAVQREFHQQRGRAENKDGLTGDVRDLVKHGVLEPSLTGPKEVSERGAVADDSHYESSFYDENGDE
jgi:hypothetical protein